MTKLIVTPTNREVFFGTEEVIVSKTDTKGRITYCNDVFLKVAGYREEDLLGQPHSIIRHPDMPRCVFKLLWDTIENGQEIFAYVKNMAKSGDHYWVLAHVTPSYDMDGNIVGYHSNRRLPERAAVDKAAALYADLLSIENRNPDAKAGMQQAYQAVIDLLTKNHVTYDEFVFSL